MGLSQRSETQKHAQQHASLRGPGGLSAFPDPEHPTPTGDHASPLSGCGWRWPRKHTLRASPGPIPGWCLLLSLVAWCSRGEVSWPDLDPEPQRQGSAPRARTADTGGRETAACQMLRRDGRGAVCLQEWCGREARPHVCTKRWRGPKVSCTETGAGRTPWRLSHRAGHPAGPDVALPSASPGTSTGPPPHPSRTGSAS